MTDLTLWKKFHELAQELFRLKPWESLYETDIFAIKSPETDKEYFISIMGSSHQVYALAAYEGAAALAKFWDIQDSDGNLPPETILTIPHFMISLDDRDTVPDDQVKLIKQMGLTYRGKNAWPVFHWTYPGMFPILPDATRLNDLRFILEQSIDVISRAVSDVSLIHPTDDHPDFLFRVATKKGEQLVWSDVRRMVTMPPLKFQIVFNRYLVNQLETIPASRSTLQADLALFPNPIREKGNPVYFPFILLLVDAKSGFVLSGDFLSPLPDYDSILSRLPEVLLKKLVDVRHRPSTIKYRNPDMKIALEFLGQQTNIKVVYSPKLPALDKVLKALRKNI